MPILPLIDPSLPLDHLLPLPIPPLAEFDLQRTTSQPALIHLPYRAGAIPRIHEANEAISPGLAGILIEHDPRHMERGVFRECLLEVILTQVLREVAHEQTKVVLRPLREGGIQPRLARGGSDACLAFGGGEDWRGGRGYGRGIRTSPWILWLTSLWIHDDCLSLHTSVIG